MRSFWLPLLICVTAGCQESAPDDIPPPIALTEEAAGHFCQMNVLEHPGPKGQVHLETYDHPLWFSQVRDAVAFERMPESIGRIQVIYVHDMGAAESWENPGDSNWIDVTEAVFVMGSSKMGGMGVPELVPFAEVADAEQFVARYGGSILAYENVTADMVLAPVEREANADLIPERQRFEDGRG